MPDIGEIGLSLGNSVVEGIAGLGLSQLNNAINDKRSRNYQRFLNQMNIDNWKMVNEYNSPKSQVARMLEAGLNPALMYGTSAGAGNAGDVGKVGSAPSYGSSSVPSSPIETYVAFKNAANLESQNNNLQEQNKLLRAQVAESQARRTKTIMDTLGVQLNNRFLDRTFEDRVKQTMQAALKSEYDTEVRRIEVEQAEQVVDRLRYTIIKIQNEIAESKNRQQLQAVQYELDNLELNLRKQGFSFQDPAIVRVLATQFPDVIPAIANWLKGKNNDGKSPLLKPIEVEQDIRKTNYDLYGTPYGPFPPK